MGPVAGTSMAPAIRITEPESIRATCAIPCIPAPEGLIAWWPLDENPGAAAFNEHIHDNDGIPSGDVAPGPGHVGNAAKFESGYGLIEAPHIDPLDFDVDEAMRAGAPAASSSEGSIRELL